MNISVIQGARDTQTLSTETRRVRDVSPALAMLQPDIGPLTTLMTRLRSRPSVDPKLEWFEDDLLPDFDKLGGSLTASAATMTVTNFKFFRKGDLVRIADNEIVLVTATPTTTAVSITRGYGTVAGAAANSGDRLLILSDAAMEFDDVRDQLTTQKVAKYNYTQIVKTPTAFTGTQMATKSFAGRDRDQELSKSLIEQKKKMEKAMILGQPYEDTTGSHPRRTTAGCVYFIVTNVKDVSGGAFTESEFEDFLRVGFRYGSREKVLLCSPKLIQSINSFGRSKLITRSDESTYGITMTEFRNAGRRVMLVEEVLLTNQDLNDLTGVAGWGILLDIMDLEMRFLNGRSTELWENIQAPGVDGQINEYRSEFGLEMHLDQKHALLTGATS